MHKLIHWLQGKTSDTQLMMLLVSLFVIFFLLIMFAKILAPVIVAVAIAYVLDGVVNLLRLCRIPRLPAIVLTLGGALIITLFALFAILPLLSEQIGRLVSSIPQYVQHSRDLLHQLQASQAEWLNSEYLQNMIAAAAAKLQEWGGALVTFSLASIPGLITLLVYAVLVPVLVFFLLKDKKQIIHWTQQFIPRERTLLRRVWGELDIQIGNYIRGKFWETFIVGISMWVAYALMGHEYALLLAVLTGISVWIPFVGAAVVTVPVILLSFFQWGWSDTTLYSVLAYAVVQTLDANLLVPWLFSEMVNLHPIAIIVAVLLFGGFWGVVGVIVAIPMAALVQSVLSIVLERQQRDAASSNEAGI